MSIRLYSTAHEGLEHRRNTFFFFFSFFPNKNVRNRIAPKAPTFDNEHRPTTSFLLIVHVCTYTLLVNRLKEDSL